MNKAFRNSIVEKLLTLPYISYFAVDIKYRNEIKLINSKINEI